MLGVNSTISKIEFIRNEGVVSASDMRRSHLAQHRMMALKRKKKPIEQYQEQEIAHLYNNNVDMWMDKKFK